MLHEITSKKQKETLGITSFSRNTKGFNFGGEEGIRIIQSSFFAFHTVTVCVVLQGIAVFLVSIRLLCSGFSLWFKGKNKGKLQAQNTFDIAFHSGCTFQLHLVGNMAINVQRKGCGCVA